MNRTRLRALAGLSLPMLNMLVHARRWNQDGASLPLFDGHEHMTARSLADRGLGAIRDEIDRRVFEPTPRGLLFARFLDEDRPAGIDPDEIMVAVDLCEEHGFSQAAGLLRAFVDEWFPRAVPDRRAGRV